MSGLLVFLAVCTAGIMYQDINDLKESVEETQNRLDVAEKRIQTMLEEGGK